MDRRTPDQRLIAAYEWVAASYGWAPAQVRRTLTHEQLLALLDAAGDRLADSFASGVEAARLGVVFAHDGKAYQRWRRRALPHRGAGNALAGAALDAAVMRLAGSHPEYVLVEGR